MKQHAFDHIARARRGATARAFSALLLLGALAACADDSTSPGDPTPSGWRDLGTLPAVERVSAVATLGDVVFVGTSAGVLRHALSASGAWEPAGLSGLDVQVLRAWAAPTATLYAGGYPTRADAQPVYRTTDGGATWTAASTGLRSAATGDWLGVADIAVQPGAPPSATPVLYATASGTNVARSLDQGATWTFVHGVPEEMATYDCLLHVHGTSLYQGCEAPLDVAWVRRYDVSQRDAARIGDGTLVVDQIENRRINAFASWPQRAALAGTLFVGVEGGLIALDANAGWRWIHRVEDGAAGPYTYVRAVWVDPADPSHLVFGGGEPEYAPDRSGLRESFDGGKTVRFPSGPAGIDFAKVGVPAAIPVGADGRDLLLVVDDGQRHRVLVWTPGAR